MGSASGSREEKQFAQITRYRPKNLRQEISAFVARCSKIGCGKLDGDLIACDLVPETGKSITDAIFKAGHPAPAGGCIFGFLTGQCGGQLLGERSPIALGIDPALLPGNFDEF